MTRIGSALHHHFISGENCHAANNRRTALFATAALLGGLLAERLPFQYASHLSTGLYATAGAAALGRTLYVKGTTRTLHPFCPMNKEELLSLYQKLDPTITGLPKLDTVEDLEAEILRLGNEMKREAIKDSEQFKDSLPKVKLPPKVRLACPIDAARLEEMQEQIRVESERSGTSTRLIEGLYHWKIEQVREGNAQPAPFSEHWIRTYHELCPTGPEPTPNNYESLLSTLRSLLIQEDPLSNIDLDAERKAAEKKRDQQVDQAIETAVRTWGRPSYVEKYDKRVKYAALISQLTLLKLNLQFNGSLEEMGKQIGYRSIHQYKPSTISDYNCLLMLPQVFVHARTLSTWMPRGSKGKDVYRHEYLEDDKRGRFEGEGRSMVSRYEASMCAEYAWRELHNDFIKRSEALLPHIRRPSSRVDRPGDLYWEFADWMRPDEGHKYRTPRALFPHE